MRLRAQVALWVVALGVGSTGAEAQVERAVTLRPGVTMVDGTSLSADLAVPMTAWLSAVGAVRGLDEGLECLGIERRIPCRATGVSFGAGARFSSATRGWNVFGEVLGGLHRYRSGADVRGLIMGGVGLEVFVSSRVSFEMGYEWRQLGADELDLSLTTSRAVRRTAQGVRFALGVGLG